MSYRTDPQNLRQLDKWFLHAPNVFLFKQSLVVYFYIKNFLELKSYKITHYSTSFYVNCYTIWFTYYRYVNTSAKVIQGVKKYKPSVLRILGNKNTKLSFSIQKLVSVRTRPLAKVNKNIIVSKHTNNKFLMLPSVKSYISPIVFKYKLGFNHDKLSVSKYFATLSDRVLTLKLMKYLEQFFGLNMLVYCKSINFYFKQSTLQLNFKLYNVFRFFRRFSFFRDTLYIANISTYCRNPLLLSDHIVEELCRVRNQWPIINLTSRLLSKLLKMRIHIKGIKLLISGRLRGRSRKKTYSKTFGQLPLQSFSKNVQYSLSQDFNVFGMFGVKLWFYTF